MSRSVIVMPCVRKICYIRQKRQGHARDVILREKGWGHDRDENGTRKGDMLYSGRRDGDTIGRYLPL
jgi:hypothetical protein